MNAQDEDRIKQLLRQAMPPVDSETEPAHDLWPEVLRRLDAEPASAAQHWLAASPPWFDWALLASLIVFAASFPATIPVFLYYL